MIKLSTLTPNPNNPRGITDSELERLKKSITGFEVMMKANKLKVDENNQILAGHQRVKALKALGYKEIPDDWVEVIDYMTEKQKKEFIARDNVENGHWLAEAFKTEYWEDEEFDEWLGDEAPYEIPNIDLKKFFAKPDEPTKEKNISITLEYTPKAHDKVVEAFKKFDGMTKEDVVYKLLGL